MSFYTPSAPISKRLFDLVLSLPLLVLFTPILVIIALQVWIFNGRMILLKQVRPNKRTRPFAVFIFRIMAEVCDAQGDLLPDADRLTPLDRFVRAGRLEELPDLFNMLRGEMSLVDLCPLLQELQNLQSQYPQVKVISSNLAYLENAKSKYSPPNFRPKDGQSGVALWKVAINW